MSITLGIYKKNTPRGVQNSVRCSKANDVSSNFELFTTDTLFKTGAITVKHTCFILCFLEMLSGAFYVCTKQNVFFFSLHSDSNIIHPHPYFLFFK